MPGLRYLNHYCIRLFLTILLAIAPFLLVLGQDYPDPANWKVERMPIGDQLGSAGAKGMVEDTLGYLWIATNNGIARYDGYTYKNYPAITGDSTTLNHGRTSFVYVDHKGILWVGTRLGINRYLSECDCFKQYNVDAEGANTVPDGEVNGITEDRDQQLWVGSQNGGLYRYNRDQDNFERFLYRKEDPLDISDFQIRALLCDRDGWVWLGTGETFVPSITGDGLIRFNPETKEVKRYFHDPEDESSLIDNRVSAFLQDSKGRVWVGSCGSGLHLYDSEKDHFVRMMGQSKQTPNIYAHQADIAPWSACPHVRVIHEDKWGGYWVGNFNGGLYRFDANNYQPRLFKQEPNNPNSLGNDLVWTFYEDKQGQFWVGNLVGGLSKIDPFKKKFQVQFPELNISAFYEAPSAPNVLWVGMWESGFFRWDRETGSQQFFEKTNPPSNGPASNMIWRFFEDSDQQLWLATEKGINRFDRSTGLFTHYPIGADEENVEDGVSILKIFEDRDGVFWLGSWGSGLYRFNKKTGAYQKYPLPYLGAEEANTYNQSIYDVYEDANGRLWLGTWMEGLYLFNRQTAKFTRYLPGVGVRTIYEGAPGKFWLGTGNDGLIEFTPEDGILRTFTERDGLAGNKVYSIFEDDQQLLWMSTNQGICSFDPREEKFITYTKADGFLTPFLSEYGNVKSDDGVFFFGSIKGLIYFRPDQIMDNPVAPTVIISDIRVFDKSLRRGEADSSGIYLPDLPKKMVLPHHQKELTFDYVGLHFSDPSKNQYRHRLVPYEEQWIAAGTKRSARYTNLNPGTYRFEILAANSDGLWASDPTFIEFRIRPPWWDTGWAFALYLLVAFGILYAIYLYQKRRWALKATLAMEQEKSQRLADMDEFKSRFYANITHEFRTPLTVIQGLTQQLRENPRWKTGEQLNLIESNSQKLLHLINQMLGLSKLEAGKLRPEYIQSDIIAYFRYLIESLHSLAFSQQINLSFHSHVDHLVMDYDSEKCQQIISNLLTNAIKFTPKYGKINVVAKVKAGNDTRKQLEVTVKDTGIGIPEDQLPYIFDRFFQVNNEGATSVDLTNKYASASVEGTGIGLALVKELLELMEGTIQVESTLHRGTTFVFTLPIRNQAPLINNVRAFPLTADAPAHFSKSIAMDQAPLVLIVEDNQDVIYYLRACLENSYQIIEAQNGRLGIDKAIETIPDIIISDVMMPDVDGFELCRTLKTDERTNHIPIILLTAKVTQEDKMEGLVQGADAYLTKPFQKEELLIRVEKLIELRRQLQERYQGTNGKSEAPEDTFLQKVWTIVLSKLQKSDFSVEELSRDVGMSRVQLYRKIKALTGHSIAQYIRLVRLNKAYDLLKQTDLTIAEVGYEVGFKDPSHFSRAFSQQFGNSPGETRK